MPPRQQLKQTSPPRRRRHQSLGEACRGLGLDVHGMRCPGCPLKVLCTTETRWRVPRTPRPRYLI